MQTTDGIVKAVEEVDREVARLAGHASAEAAADLDDLRQAWSRLVDLLLLGSPPGRRMCAHCGCVGEANATRCARCWKVLIPAEGSVE